jgi:hypothetical protein
VSSFERARLQPRRKFNLLNAASAAEGIAHQEIFHRRRHKLQAQHDYLELGVETASTEA